MRDCDPETDQAPNLKSAARANLAADVPLRPILNCDIGAVTTFVTWLPPITYPTVVGIGDPSTYCPPARDMDAVSLDVDAFVELMAVVEAYGYVTEVVSGAVKSDVPSKYTPFPDVVKELALVPPFAIDIGVVIVEQVGHVTAFVPRVYTRGDENVVVAVCRSWKSAVDMEPI